MAQQLPVARLPAPALALGSFALFVGLVALKSLLKDIAAGRPPWIAAGFANTVALALAWVYVDQPTSLVVEGRVVYIVTRVRRVRVDVVRAERAPAGWDGGLFGPKFAINGGYGWYGWFWREGRWQRAYVTDKARAVRLFTSSGVVVVSPLDPGALLSALA